MPKMKYKTYRFFEGAPGECAGVLSVNTVTGDGHQMTLGRHDVAKQGQVTVVDVGTVKRDDVVHLSLNGLSHGLNTQSLERKNIVRFFWFHI